MLQELEEEERVDKQLTTELQHFADGDPETLTKKSNHFFFHSPFTSPTRGNYKGVV